MPRQVRIQYSGAVYHLMARGDRREAIFFDDADRKGFLGALGQVCGRTGWRVHAYALMDNHYHLVVETPEPNLVDGMGWLQNTYTRRFNLRHCLWGHLFGGRYKAVLVDRKEGDYFPILVDYVHLNPIRAGMVKLQDGLESFAWTSLHTGYARAPGTRPPWLEVERSQRARGLEDTVAGRRNYLAHLEERVRVEGEAAGRMLPTGQSLQSTLRRGWYFGGEAFKEEMLTLAGDILKGKRRTSNYRSAPEVREHSIERAENLVQRGLKVCGLSEGELAGLARGDQSKVLIALAIRRETTASLDWISRRLAMGARSTVSREVGSLASGLPKRPHFKKLYDEITQQR